MANPKINITVGAKAQLNGVEMLASGQLFPVPPSTVPLTWTISDHTVAEFLEANADRTFIQVKGLKVGTATVTLTDGILTTALLDLNIIAASAPAASAARIQVLPLPVPSGDPFGE